MLGQTVKDLGRPIGSYSLSTAVLQRAAIVAAVSFFFFLIMLVAFYVRGHFGYFALSTAFLAVYIFTFVSWVIRRRSVVTLHENGIRYRGFRACWEEIRSVNAGKEGLRIVGVDRAQATIPRSVDEYDSILRAVKKGVERSG